MRERFYDSACFLLANANMGAHGDYREPVPELIFEKFLASLLARATAGEESNSHLNTFACDWLSGHCPQNGNNLIRFYFTYCNSYAVIAFLVSATRPVSLPASSLPLACRKIPLSPFFRHALTKLLSQIASLRDSYLIRRSLWSRKFLHRIARLWHPTQPLTAWPDR